MHDSILAKQVDAEPLGFPPLALAPFLIVLGLGSGRVGTWAPSEATTNTGRQEPFFADLTLCVISSRLGMTSSSRANAPTSSNVSCMKWPPTAWPVNSANNSLPPENGTCAAVRVDFF